MEKLSTSERSPLSPTRWPPEAFAWPRALAALVIIGLAYAAGLVLASVVAVQFGITQADVQAQRLSWGILLAQLASYVVVVPTILLVLPWLAQRSLRDLGLRLPDRRAIGAGVVGAIAMYAVTIGIASAQFAITHQKPEEAAITMLTGTRDPRLALAFGVLAVGIAPFVEELEFRGFLFNVLLRYTPMWLAAVISGLVFGMSHGSPTALLPLAGSGIVLAYVYYLTGSLSASMITHALFNAINVVLISLGKTA